MSEYGIRVGDVFEDLDPRRKGRRFVITGTHLDGRAICSPVSGNGPRFRVRYERLRPISAKRGYKPVQLNAAQELNEKFAHDVAEREGQTP